MRMINRIRLENAQTIIRDREAGNKSAFARKIGTDPAYFLQITSEKTKKNIGDDLAIRIESAYGMPDGWLDLPHHHEDFLDLSLLNDKNKKDLISLRDTMLTAQEAEKSIKMPEKKTAKISNNQSQVTPIDPTIPLDQLNQIDSGLDNQLHGMDCRAAQFNTGGGPK